MAKIRLGVAKANELDADGDNIGIADVGDDAGGGRRCISRTLTPTLISISPALTPAALTTVTCTFDIGIKDHDHDHH